MEGEVINFIMVWLSIFSSLLYCRSTTQFIPKGTTRLCAFLPIFSLFIYLPLNLTAIHFCGLTSFFISWLANFKLMLLAFDKGPLFSNPPLPLSRFISTACLPIKTVPSDPEKPSNFGDNKTPSPKLSKNGMKSPLNYTLKLMLFVVFTKLYFTESLHPKLRVAIYCFIVYFMLEIMLAAMGILGRALIRVELEPQFNEPYLATSLQDFWGRRWNLMVTGILHPTVYEPVKSFSSRLIPAKWAPPLLALFATFFVSGVMHELVFYHLGRLKPTGEVTLYFMIHGASLAIEFAMKKSLNGKFHLPPAVSGPMALGFVIVTSLWLFFPPYLRFGPDLKACKEHAAFLEFVAHGKLVSPNNISCPLY